MKRFVTIAMIFAIPLVLVASPAMAQKYNPAINPPAKPFNTLTDQEKADGWELLFDGKTLKGWERDENFPGEWSVTSDGIIFSAKGATHLFSAKKYKDIDLSWDVCAYDVGVPDVDAPMASPRMGNSGVFVRGIKSGGSFPQGYEVQVDPYDIKNPTGGVYGKNPGTLLVTEDGKWKPEAFFQIHEGKWMHQRVRIEGNRLQIWVNGEKTMDWTDPDKSFPEAGYIALQNHHKTDVVLFTNIKIKVLD